VLEMPPSGVIADFRKIFCPRDWTVFSIHQSHTQKNIMSINLAGKIPVDRTDLAERHCTLRNLKLEVTDE